MGRARGGLPSGRWRQTDRPPILVGMCFNLRFDSEEELAAIAAGMSGHTEATEAQPRTPEAASH